MSQRPAAPSPPHMRPAVRRWVLAGPCCCDSLQMTAAAAAATVHSGDTKLLWYPLVAYCTITVTALVLLYSDQDRYAESRYECATAAASASPAAAASPAAGAATVEPPGSQAGGCGGQPVGVRSKAHPLSSRPPPADRTCRV